MVAFVISISLFLLARQVIVQAVTATQDGLLNAAVQSIVDKITVIDGTVSLDLPYDTFRFLAQSARTESSTGSLKTTDF